MSGGGGGPGGIDIGGGGPGGIDIGGGWCTSGFLNLSTGEEARTIGLNIGDGGLSTGLNIGDSSTSPSPSKSACFSLGARIGSSVNVRVSQDKSYM